MLRLLVIAAHLILMMMTWSYKNVIYILYFSNYCKKKVDCNLLILSFFKQKFPELLYKLLLTLLPNPFFLSYSTEEINAHHM